MAAEFTVLGSLRVSVAGQPVEVGAARKRRLLLAVLLALPGRPVSTDLLVEAVWGDQPPASARANLQLYVHQLRRALGDAAITARGGGYTMDPGEELDSIRFQKLAAAGGESLDAGEVTAAEAMLRRALDLWHGEAFTEFLDCAIVAGEARRLELLRLETYERWAEARLAAGPTPRLAVELTELCRLHPYRESLRGHLMRALYRTGRQAEALAAFHETRALLVEELGVEPGPELRSLHEAMLRGDDPPMPARRIGTADLPLPRAVPAPGNRPAGTSPRGDLAPAGSGAPARPAQLPRDVPGFTGRETELSQLDDLLAGGGVVAVSGLAGVGKTALVVHWAHRARSRFPDGQLYVNLRGYDPGGQATEPWQAVCGFLDALGVAPHRVPADLEAQAALYRTLLADKRVLVLLDNAQNADQVRPLLPGSAGCAVLITSRGQLSSLVAAEGAVPLTLDLLTTVASGELLARRLGSDVVAADPSAVDAIISGCERLPLALTIAAARILTEPQLSLPALAAELNDARDRLDVLSGGDPVSDIRAVLSWSYERLDPPVASMFRLLGLHPGPDLTPPAAASLAGVPPADARRALAALTAAHLCAEHRPGRYRCHDLVRAYATELVQSIDDGTVRRAACGRLYDHYVHTAYGGNRLLDPQRDAIALPPARSGVRPEGFADREQAMDWFTAERPALLAVVAKAAASGFDSHVWRLVWSLATALDRRGHWQDWVISQRAAVAAAQRLADRPVQARTHRDLGLAYTRLGRFQDAQHHLGTAIDLYAEVGDDVGRAHTYLFLAVMLEREGSRRHRDGLGHALRALELFERAGHRRGRARALNAVGWKYAQLGDHQQAIGFCERALALHRAMGDRVLEASAWDSLGYAYRRAGQHPDAVACYRRALEVERGTGYRSGEAETLTYLGDAHHAAGEPAAARDAWQRALRLLTELDHPGAGQVRDKLRLVESPPPAG